jgi:epsilon-lactone hydrolase
MSAVSWQARLVQLALRLFVRPRLTAEHGPASARVTLNRMAKLVRPPPRGIALEAGTLGGVRGEWIRARLDKSGHHPVVIYFHGGGYIAGTPRLSRPVVVRVVAQCGGEAFSAAYRLAPEHPFPAALDDAIACYDGLVQSGCAPHRIVLAGDSAGGGLALALALKIRDSAPTRQMPAGIALISPWVDLTLSGASIAANAEIDPIIHIGFAKPARRMYLPGGRYDDPFASPLFARLDGLPPVFMQVGTCEIVLDDARRLAARLESAGVKHALEVWEGMHHDWQLSPVEFPEVRSAVTNIAKFVAAVSRKSG